MLKTELLSTQPYWIGIGCQKGVSQQLIQTAVEAILQAYQLNLSKIAGIATIDSKISEPGLIAFCDLHNLPLKTFASQILATVTVPNPTITVKNSVGTPSVAEAAAVLAASTFNTGNAHLLVPKQIFRLPEAAAAVTIAIAH
jgi:cobalt-precorrin 5A hydrolase